MPLQVFVELQHNLTYSEMRDSMIALRLARGFRLDDAPGPLDGIDRWVGAGARLGDATLSAQLESAGVDFLISENRHFLLEIPGLPFAVLSAEEALDILAQG